MAIDGATVDRWRVVADLLEENGFPDEAAEYRARVQDAERDSTITPASWLRAFRESFSTELTRGLTLIENQGGTSLSLSLEMLSDRGRRYRFQREISRYDLMERRASVGIPWLFARHGAQMARMVANRVVEVENEP